MDYELCKPCRQQVDEKKMCGPCQDELLSRKAAFAAMTVEANSDAFEIEDVIYADSQEA